MSALYSDTGALEYLLHTTPFHYIKMYSYFYIMYCFGSLTVEEAKEEAERIKEDAIAKILKIQEDALEKINKLKKRIVIKQR